MDNRMQRIAVLLCVVALATTGCDSRSSGEAAAPGANVGGSTTNPRQASKALDVCSLVTREDVAATIDEAIVQVEAKGDTCSYQTEDAMASSVEIEVKQTGGKDEMQTAREAAGFLGKIGADMKGAKGAKGDLGTMLDDASSVSGIGDEAFFGANQQLHVLKNNVYFTVSPPMMRSRMGSGNPMLTAEEKREMARVIAQKVAAKL